MSWVINPKETGSINDGGSKLPIGTTVHKIEKISRPVNSKDLTGKERQVLIETTSEGHNYKVYLNPESSSDSVSNIAKKTLVGFWEAAGFTDAIKPERLNKLEGKWVELVVEETAGKKGTANEGKTFTNIKKVNAASSPEEEQAEEEPHQEEEPEAEEEEPQEEAPKPAAKKAMPWKTSK